MRHLVLGPVGRRFYFLAFAAIISGCGNGSTDSTIMTEGFPLYGPGEHWVDAVEAGVVRFEAAATVGIDFDRNGASDALVSVVGPTTVARTASRSVESGGTHRTHVDLEIVDMVLRGDSITVRAGDLAGNFQSDGALHSIGESDESVAQPELAHDQFRIFFELEIGGEILHNRDPLLVEATIDRLPPIGNEFAMVKGPLALFDALGSRVPFQIVSVKYVPTGRLAAVPQSTHR